MKIHAVIVTRKPKSCEDCEISGLCGAYNSWTPPAENKDCLCKERKTARGEWKFIRKTTKGGEKLVSIQ